MFQAEYKSISKYLSTYYGGVLSVCWVAPFDSFSFCLRIPEEGFFVFASGRIKYRTALANVKVLIVHLYYCFVFLLNINEHHVYE